MTIRHLLTISALSLTLALTAGCTVFGGGSDDEASDLDTARQEWESLDWENYTLRIFRGCFCVGAGEYDVWVRGGEIVAVRPTNENVNDVQVEWWDEFPTMEDLFATAERALQEAGDVEISYGTEPWYLTLNIDWITEAVDDEMLYRVIDVDHAPAGDVFELAPGSSRASHGLSIQFDGVASDSRCALDVQCIWAGEARIDLTVTDGSGGTTTATLVDGATQDTPVRYVDIGDVRIHLLAVLPYPARAGDPVTASDYRARLLVENR